MHLALGTAFIPHIPHLSHISHTMTPITHILYDLGGTLLYFDGEWDAVFERAVRASAAALPEAGMAVVDPVRFCAAFSDAFQAYYVQREIDQVERTAAHVLHDTLAGLGAPLPEEAAAAKILDAFYGVTQAHWLPVPGVHAVLGEMQSRGIRQGILSNASHDADVQTLVDRADLRRYMDFVISSAEIGMRKPHARAFRAALDRWDAPREQILMVGDTPEADILGAGNIGIRSAWVRRYARPAEEMDVFADVEIQGLEELQRVIAA